ncbi:MAG: DinB family protein [Chloroflexaceae bacterium]|jgi:uncharacterized damage-inducible protein DinB|nr:DinB family protein [Chloroflexaceae bacterium]
MITSVVSFISYFESVRRRTLNYFNTIPPEQLEWRPKPGEFTCGDIIRHLAAAEQMYVGLVVEGRWIYPGHEADADSPVSLEATLAACNASHMAAMERLRQLPDSVLEEMRPPLGDGPPIKVWRWLLLLAEHEIHHRSQLAMYLTLLDVTPPHIYGMGVEEVIARATG